MSTRKQPQGRNLRNLIADTLSTRTSRKTVEKLMVPVMPRNAFKFDPMEFWLETFSEVYQGLLDNHWERGMGTIDAPLLAQQASSIADAALFHAEDRWGRQRVK